ncbi:MAG: peptidoglycan-binding protein [Patescibacteria group bacterium]|nr:peptidoglycan-binding protein [Patescibacteria group bacterium]
MSKSDLILLTIILFLLSEFEFVKAECVFKRNLYLGSRGEDVRCLQNYLREKKILNFSPTGFYDGRTKLGVRRWQKLNNIYPADGNFNSSSIIFFNKEQEEKSKLETLLKKVDLNKIKIDENNGIGDLVQYYQQVFVDFKPLAISSETIKYFSIDEPFSLSYQIYVIINNQDNFEREKIKEKNKIFSSFFKERVNFLYGLKIKSNLRNFHLAIILNDILSLELSAKLDDYLNKKIDLDELKNELGIFNLQLNLIRKSYINDYLQLTSRNKYFLLDYLSDNKILKSFLKQANAFSLGGFSLGIPFGGRIVNIIWCPCSGFARLITIGPPLPPAPPFLYVPAGFEATGAVYAYWNLYTPQVWVLGLYLPASIPCMQFGVTACFPIGFGNQILMVGTSLGP